MFTVKQLEFENIVNLSINELSKKYAQNLNNLAIIIEDYPSKDQRRQLKLNKYQTLFGLYEGTPLSKRQGNLKILPDKITLFKYPLELASNSMDELKENIYHTLWHEIAHYFGLNHGDIKNLE